MTPPEQITVGNHVYDVTWGKIRRAGVAHYGRTKPTQTRMWVDDTKAASQVRDTLLHEVLHAVLADTPVRLGESDEEAVVRGLTPGLLAVLRNNPDVVKFLLED